MNPYANYYVNQAGNGITGFSGTRYQRGHGWFGRLFSSAILPALKYLGKQSLSTGLNIAEDVLDGKKLKEAALNRTAESGRKTIKDSINRARVFAQTGKGMKRKASMPSVKITLKKRKVLKRKVKSKKNKNYKKKRVMSSLFD